MSESLVTKIENARKKIRQYKKEIPSEIGKKIIKNHKVPVINAHGDFVKYKGNVRQRKLRGYNDFKANFSIVKKDPNINNRVISKVDYLAKNYNLEKNPNNLAQMIENTANAADDPTIKRVYHMVVWDHIDYDFLRKIVKKHDNNSNDDNGSNADDSDNDNINDSDDDSSDDSTDNSDNSDDENQTESDQTIRAMSSKFGA